MKTLAVALAASVATAVSFTAASADSPPAQSAATDKAVVKQLKIIHQDLKGMRSDNSKDCRAVVHQLNGYGSSCASYYSVP